MNEVAKYIITKEQIEKIFQVIRPIPTETGMIAVDTIREVMRNPLPASTDATVSDATQTQA